MELLDLHFRVTCFRIFFRYFCPIGGVLLVAIGVDNVEKGPRKCVGSKGGVAGLILGRKRIGRLASEPR